MYLSMLKSKIHRATVTDANIEYVGSITIDADLMEKAGIREFEKVLVADVDNGSRIETYVMEGERGSGCICMNGAAARCCSVGDIVIIMAFAMMSEEEADAFKPAIVLVDQDNRAIEQGDH